MNQQSKSNKPLWDDAPSWANWLACDRCGAWYWYINEPDIPDGNNFWNNSDSSLYGRADGLDADPSWSHDNWESSLEERPGHNTPNPYLSSPDKKRVTLFIDFDGPVSDDHQLARNTATMLRSWFNGEDCAVHLFTPGSHSVSRVRIAVGSEKMEEVEYDFDGYHIKEHKHD